MDKTTQDLAWACLPKEVRKEVRLLWELDTMPVHPDYDPDSVAEGATYILTDLFGHHNLTSDTEPDEMLMVERKKVQEIYHQIKLELGDGGCSEYQDDVNMEKESLLKSLFGDKCLPDKIQDTGFGGMSLTPPAYKLDVETDTPNPSNSGELKSQKSEIQPKLNKGDKVKIVNVSNPMMRDKIGIIEKLPTKDKSRYKVRFAEDHWTLLEAEYLEPYTEPETKDNMEEKELNLCELLKGCEGEEIFSTFEGNMTITKVTDSNIVLHGHNTDLHCGNGFYPSGICQLYPSRALYEKYPLGAKKAWDEWASERKPKRWIPQIGERIFWVNSHGTVSQDVCRSDIEGNGHQLKRRVIGNEFKTGKEAEQAAEAVRECLEKFHKDQTQP